MNPKQLWHELGMTIEQFRTLLPGGAQDRDGFPGMLVTSDTEKTFKERMRERDKREGWVRKIDL